MYITLVDVVILNNLVDVKILDRLPVGQEDLQAERSDVQASTHVDPPSSFGNIHVVLIATTIPR